MMNDDDDDDDYGDSKIFMKLKNIYVNHAHMLGYLNLVFLSASFFLNFCFLFLFFLLDSFDNVPIFTEMFVLVIVSIH